MVLHMVLPLARVGSSAQLVPGRILSRRRIFVREDKKGLEDPSCRSSWRKSFFLLVRGKTLDELIVV